MTLLENYSCIHWGQNNAEQETAGQ